jgi:hypothetical protein
MDSTTRNRYLIIGVAVCILISIVILAWVAYYRRNSKKSKKNNKGMLWLNEDKSMLEPHVFDTALDVSGNEVAVDEEEEEYGVSYTMNINILKWLYDKKVNYREILTHGTGSFEYLDSKDIISLAIDSKKNDIIIKVNTVRGLGPDITTVQKLLCDVDARRKGEQDDESEVANHEEQVAIKYFPLDEFFHIGLVLSKKRLDVYKNGQLYGSKVFEGKIPGLKKRRKLFPIKFFHGKPIRGVISNFMYFERELTIPEMKHIFHTGRKPGTGTDTNPEKLGENDMIHANECDSTLPSFERASAAISGAASNAAQAAAKAKAAAAQAAAKARAAGEATSAAIDSSYDS